MLREFVNKSSIIIEETEKRLCFLEVGRSRPATDSFHFDGVHHDVVFRDDETKVLHGLLIEEAFFGFEEEFVFSESMENSSYSMNMGLIV